MKKLLLICCLLFSLSAWSQDEAKIRQTINQTASAMKAMQCDFVQTKHLKMLNDKMVAKGRMYYQQPNRLRWEYTSPYSYVFILNGDKVLLKNQQRNDVIDTNQNKLFREIARIMMNTVVGKCLSDDKDFKTTLVETPTEWVATLLPQRKDMKQMFQKVVLHFNRQKAMVSLVELIEKKGDKTIIELKNVRANEAVSEKIFAVR